MEQVKTVTCLIDWYSPAFKAGGPIRSLSNMATALGKDFKVRIICSDSDYDGTLLNVPTEQWVKRPEGPEVYYTKNKFRGIRQALKDAPSVLFINGIYSYQFNLLPLLFLKGRKIVSVRGMLHPGGLRQKRLKKRIYLALWNILGISRRCEFHATTEGEREFIRKVFGNVRIWVVPNIPRILPMAVAPVKEANCLKLCSIALISPMKNHHLVLEALLRASAKISYDIYGPVKDEAYWERCQELISSMPRHIKVQYHGVIEPEQTPTAMASCHVFVQPSLAENFSHSLFEALVCGRPIITSHHTPWNKLETTKAGVNVGIADCRELSAAIERFAVMNQQVYSEWSDSARYFALQQIDIDTIRHQYFEMFKAAAMPESKDN